MATLILLWQRRAEIALGLVLVSAILLWGAGQKIRALQSELAARPKTEQSRESKKTEEPVITRERETRTTDENGHRVVIIEREIEKGRVETTTSTDTKTEPVGPAPRRASRIIGVGTSPLDERAVSVRAGLTFYDRLDLTAGWSFYGPAESRPRIEAAWRF